MYSVCPQLFACLNCLPSNVCPETNTSSLLQVANRSAMQVKLSGCEEKNKLMKAMAAGSTINLSSVTSRWNRMEEHSKQVCTSTVCPQLLSALNYCLPSTTVCPQLFALS